MASLQAAQPPLLSLWPSGPPDGWRRDDVEETVRPKGEDFVVVRRVSSPTLRFDPAAHAAPHAPTAIVLPGGGYNVEAIEHEGWEIAARLNEAGIHSAVLKYRLPNRDADRPLYRAPLQDVQRAIRLVQARAPEWGIDPSRVGLLGFSAGGHLAALASNASAATYVSSDDVDAYSFGPNFTVLIYPAYLDTAGKPRLSDAVTLRHGAPPAFVIATGDDPHAMSALAYALACREAGVPAELHLFPKGGHGYGLRTHEPGLSGWMDLLVAWLKRPE